MASVADLPTLPTPTLSIAEMMAAPSVSISEAPTVRLSGLPATANTGSGSSGERFRTRRKGAEAPRRKGRRRLIVGLATLAVLLALVLPGIAAASAGLQDYSALKTLGEDGLQHLLHIQTDLAAYLPTSHGTGAGSSVIQQGVCERLMAGQLPSSLTGQTAPTVINPAYTLLVQRQSGTFYTVQATIHPAKGISADGTKTAQYNVTLNGATPLTLGGQPAAQPTTATTTPTATATTTATTSATKKTSLIPDAATIAAVQQDLKAAQTDFANLRDRLDHPDWVLSLAGNLPVANGDIATAQALAYVGYDIATMGLILLGSVQPLLTRLHAAKSLTSGETQLLTQADITGIQHGIDSALVYFGDAQTRLNGVNINNLPLKASQKALFASIMPELPCIHSAFLYGRDLVGAVGWALGVDQPRSFLVQTLDRAELRPSGGFTGDWGLLTFNEGKLGPFSLHDVNYIDYGGNGYIFGNRPPSQYSWWPFANWGLRDSNLSADFPTNAKLVLSVFHKENGPAVDGLIDISPVVIEHVLAVTGPLYVPLYNETITASNLEDRLHYYQQDPAGIAREQALQPNDTSTSARKRFTQLVGQLLQKRVKQLPTSELLPLARQLFADLRNHDLEVYFTNPTLENLLTRLHADGAVDETPNVDGWYFTQANVSVAKSTPFVKVVEKDDVTLDSKGGATHSLTITMAYDPTGNVYGYATYRDYVRIYTPPDTRLISADGFDTGQALCWAPPSWDGKVSKPKLFASVPNCSADPYPNGELVCPAGAYGPGNQAPTITGSDGYTPWDLDQLGAPPNTHSDLPGRNMWGGYVVIPPLCTETLTLTWYSPHVAPPAIVPGATPTPIPTDTPKQ